MVDIRVWQVFFKMISYGIGVMAAVCGIVYLSNEWFDNPTIIPMVLLWAYTLYMLFGIAKSKVEMDRKAEQRLADQIKDTQ